MNNDRNTEGKGLAQTTAENIQKIRRLKRIIPIIASSLPAIGIFLLVVLMVVIIFMPIIANYNFAGGIFNSSNSYNERSPMTMNLGGYGLEDVQIFQDIVDQRKKFKELGTMKSDVSEELDLALLISTIQGNIVNNFNDDGDVYKLDDAIHESEQEINNFKSIDDFNDFVDKYGTPKPDPGTEDKEYNNDTILENDQNKDYYNNLKDKAGNVYYIFPGERKLMGNMVYNDISYGTLEYERWQCDSSSGWCDNAKEIWSEWSILRDITSNNGENADCEDGNSTICNIRAAISYAEGYSGDSNSWEYKNIKFDLEQLRKEVLGGDDSNNIEQVIIELSGNSDAKIPNGGFVVGQEYVTVNVRKKADYDLYENYTENVFLKHLFLDCDNCEYKDESDEIKAKHASVLYDNIYSMKELFDYFNDGSNSSGNFYGGVPYEYNCEQGGLPSELTYDGHEGWDLNIGSNTMGTNIYPLFNGVVTEAVYSSSYRNCVPVKKSNGGYSCGHCRSSYGTPSLGNHVKVCGKAINGNEYCAVYGHLSGVNVKVGDTVDEKTVLGQAGNTGCSTAPHLHIALSHPNGSGYVNPYTWRSWYGDSYRSVMCSR